MRRALLLAAALAWLARPAAACNNRTGTDVIVAAAEDGSFVRVARVSGGAYIQTVTVVGADGRDRASCVSFDGGAWDCRGDRAFAVPAHEQLDAVAQRWARLIDATAARVPVAIGDAPPGITEALCARVPLIWAGELTIDCQADNTSVLRGASSPLLVLRRHVGPLTECGATTEFDQLFWVARDQLADRLARRSALFTARRRPELASHADQARAWLLGAP